VLESLVLPDRQQEIDDVAAAAPLRRFRWEAEMLDPVAKSMPTLAPWFEAPAALIAEVPAAVGVVDLLGVRFDARALRRRVEADVRPVLSPLRVRVLHALLVGPRPVDELAASVGTHAEALMRSTLGPLEEAELVELEGGEVQSTGLWLPVAQRVVAVELKLTKWRDALIQADNFRRSADESWVVVDAARAGAARAATLEFAEHGVGLAVATVDGRVDVVLPAPRARPEGWLHALIAERALAATDDAMPLFSGSRRSRRPRLESDPRAVAVVA
jgi:hypothetical protein